MSGQAKNLSDQAKTCGGPLRHAAPMSTPPVRRETTFPSGGTACGAWHLTATDDALTVAGRRPCVVMAHGFGGTRDTGLLAYAEGFAAAGLDVLAFDYRGFGTSGGTPRQRVSYRDQ